MDVAKASERLLKLAVSYLHSAFSRDDRLHRERSDDNASIDFDILIDNVTFF